MEPEKRRRSKPLFAPSPRRPLPQFQLRPQWWNWTGLKRALDRRITSHSSDALSHDQVRGLRYFWLDGVFASLSDNLLVSFLSLFMLAYGATNGQVGLLTSVANLFAITALLPGAHHAERVRSRKRLVLWTGGGFSRALIVLLVLLPFSGVRGQEAVWAIIIINGFRNFLGSYANPAWTGMVADLVPAKRRSRYFSDRNLTMGAAALAVTVIGGILIRRLPDMGLGGLAGYQVVFVGAFAFGVLSTISFAKIPEGPGRIHSDPRVKREPIGAILKRHPEFVAFLAGALVWNISIQMAAPFFSIYLVTQIGGTAESVGLAAGATTLFGLLGTFVFGKVSDRKGSLAVIRSTGLIIPIVPIIWSIATAPWHAYVVSALAGFAWAGFNLANFNMLLELAPAESRSRAVALYQAIVFASAVAGPLVGGMLIDLFSFRHLFLGTAIGRWIGIGLFLFLISSVRRAAPRSAD